MAGCADLAEHYWRGRVTYAEYCRLYTDWLVETCRIERARSAGLHAAARAYREQRDEYLRQYAALRGAASRAGA